MTIRDIHQNDIEILRQFVRNLGEGTQTFRYFSGRPFTVIENHLVTLMMFDKDAPVAYGHLDPESDRVWLGVAVIPFYQGGGNGRRMMAALLNKALELKLQNVWLSVDHENMPAIKLYESIGFSKVESSNSNNIYKYQIA